MKRRLLSCLGLAFVAFCLLSPCRATEVQPVAFLSLIKEGADKEVAKTIGELNEDQRKELGSHGFRWFNFYTEKLGDRRVLLCTFDLEKGTHAEEVWKAAQEGSTLKPWWTKLSTSLAAHPRVAAQGGLWTRCETICALQSYVAPELRGEKFGWHAGVTGLKKEKEAEYRLLHNQVWPGVVDAIGNAGIERFDVFLIELGEQIYLFDHFLFVGKDLATDTARMGKNPVNQRWWAITDPCQQPLPSAAARKEIWEPMEAAVELAK